MSARREKPRSQALSRMLVDHATRAKATELLDDGLEVNTTVGSDLAVRGRFAVLERVRLQEPESLILFRRNLHLRRPL